MVWCNNLISQHQQPLKDIILCQYLCFIKWLLWFWHFAHYIWNINQILICISLKYMFLSCIEFRGHENIYIERYTSIKLAFKSKETFTISTSKILCEVYLYIPLVITLKFLTCNFYKVKKCIILLNRWGKQRLFTSQLNPTIFGSILFSS